MHNSVIEFVRGELHANMVRGKRILEIGSDNVNGSVRLTLPDELNTAVRVKTVNGPIQNDLALSVTRSGKRRLEGSLGQSSRTLLVETVNGSVRLKQAG